MERHPAFLQIRPGDRLNQPGLFDLLLLGQCRLVNYNAGFVSYRVRKWNGLTLDANLTFAHSLDTRGLNQDVDTASSFSYNLAYDYGTSAFDRKVVFNLLSVYELPFGKHGHGPLNYLAQGWSIAPIFTIASGLPLKVATGSGQEDQDKVAAPTPAAQS